MLDFLAVIFDSINHFFIFIGSFFTSGIYDLLTWAFAKFVEGFLITGLNFLIWALPFSWGVAKQVLVDLNITSVVNAAWGSVDSGILGYANLLQLPEALNLLISAYMTRFVLRFIPFIG